MKKITKYRHLKRHKLLHEHLDELVADFIFHTGALSSKVSILKLIEWSAKQIEEPDEIEKENKNEIF